MCLASFMEWGAFELHVVYMEIGKRFLTRIMKKGPAEGEFHPFHQVQGQRWEEKMQGGG